MTITFMGETLDETGATPVTTQLQNIIDNLPNPPPNVTVPSGMYNTPLTLPQGVWLLDDPDSDGICLKIDKSITFSAPGSLFLVPANTVGIQVGDNAPWSKYHDLELLGTGWDDGATGIQVHAHGVRMQHIHCASLWRGVSAEGEVNGDVFAHNVNAQHWDQMIFRNIGSGGAIHVSGKDGQVGSFTNFEILSCRCGIWEDSAFGNFFGPGSIEGIVPSDPPQVQERAIYVPGLSCGAMFSGVWIESGETCHIRSSQALVMGGNLPSFVDAVPIKTHATVSGISLTDMVGGGRSRITFRHSATTPIIMIPGRTDPQDPDVLVEWYHPGKSEYMTWRLKHYPHVPVDPNDPYETEEGYAITRGRGGAPMIRMHGPWRQGSAVTAFVDLDSTT